MRIALLVTLSALLPACHHDCPVDPPGATAALVEFDPVDPEEDVPEQCCEVADSPEAVAELCDSHPLGRSTDCGKKMDPPVQEPQTSEACQNFMRVNAPHCISQYVACRDALRVAACDECPAECAPFEGAC